MPLQSADLSLRFSIDGDSVDAGCCYAGARPYGDFLITTIPGHHLQIASAYLGTAGFPFVPVLHKIEDGELGDDVEHGRLEPPSPGGIATVARLLLDHLSVIQEAFFERRALALLIDVEDVDLDELEQAARVLIWAPR